jgi:integrase
LYLETTVSGRKHWLLRIAHDGKRRDLGLGRYPDVSLKDARVKRDRIRREVATGAAGNPMAAHRKIQEGVPTLMEAAHVVFGDLLRNGKFRKGENSSAAQRWIGSMRNHLTDDMKDRPVSQLTSADISNVIDAVNKKGLKDVPRDLRNRLNVICKWARARCYLDHNPCDVVEVPRSSKKTNHYRSLPYSQISEFVRELRQSDRSLPTIRLALELTIYTGGRCQEARFSKWGEIDWDRKIWTVPPDNMKSGDYHQIPLCNRAIEILGEAEAYRRADDLIFPGQKPGKPMSENTLNGRIKQMGYGEIAVAHGFRATFRTWSSECTDFPRELCELVLDHDVGNDVERSYRRGQQTERRRPIMEAWEAFIAGDTA